MIQVEPPCQAYKKEKSIKLTKYFRVIRHFE